MKQEELKKYIRKLVKEAVQEEKAELKEKAPPGWEGTVKAMKKSGEVENPWALAWNMKDKGYKPHYKMKNGKSVKKEHLQAYSKVLEGRKNLIESIITEKGFFDKFGSFDPSKKLDDPKYLQGELNKAISKAEKFGKQFSEKILNTSSAINAYHDAVIDALDKYSSFGDMLKIDGSDYLDVQMKDEYEAKVIGLAKQFYQLLNNEKGRIESFNKELFKDLADKGFDKSMVTVTKKPKSAAKPEDEELLDRSKLKTKGEIPMSSVGQSMADMATNWIK